MPKPWLNLSTSAEAAKFSTEKDEELRRGVQSGDFWADRLKLVKDDPEKRLAIAMENLPLPGAFSESAIALRAMIREKRKASEPYDAELKQLYELAAVWSFHVPRCPVIDLPGYNVLANTPGGKILALGVDYDKLGYEHLDLLKKTDRKWLVESWGEPGRHSTLHQDHADFYRQCALATKKAFDNEMRAILSGPKPATPEPPLRSTPSPHAPPLRAPHKPMMSRGTFYAIAVTSFLIVYWAVTR